MQDYTYLNRLREVQATVEKRIHCESHDVQGEKIEVQADDALPFQVDVDLRVEGHRPGGEVDPTHYVGNDADRFGMHHCHP